MIEGLAVVFPVIPFLFLANSGQKIGMTAPDNSFLLYFNVISIALTFVSLYSSLAEF